MTWFWIAGLAVLLLVAFAAFLPTSTDGLMSRPGPAPDYDSAVARVRRQQAADAPVVAPGGNSILLTHGRRTPRAVVLLHGFTNSPRQFQAFAELLYAAGDNVYVPRLPHHAERDGSAKVLARLAAEELRDCGDSAVDVADGLADSVVVVGLSAGGTMAAWIAQHRADVGRVVIIAPVLELTHLPSILATPLMNLALRAPEITQSFSREPARPDREPGNSSHATAQILRLGLAVRRTADRDPPQVREIVFLMNANDRTVKTGPAVALAERWTRAGIVATVYQLPASIGLAHDIIDESQPTARPAVVYPVLEALAHGERPPALLLDGRLWPR